MNEHRLFIDGGWEDGASSREILSPFSGKAVARCAQASPEQLERALASAERSGKAFRKISRFGRARLLVLMARGIETRRAELVEAMVAEAGKPRTLADGEVGRAIVTFTLAAEEAKRSIFR